MNHCRLSLHILVLLRLFPHWAKPARQRLKNEKSFKICIMTDVNSLFIVNFYVGNEEGAVNVGSIGEHFEVAYVKIYLNKPVKVRLPSPYMTRFTCNSMTSNDVCSV